MSQGSLCPNLTKKVQKWVSPHNLPIVMLLGSLSVYNLKPPKTHGLECIYFSCQESKQSIQKIRDLKNSPVKGWGGLSKMSKNVKMSIHPTTHRWEWIHKSKIVKDNWIISIRLSFIWLLVIWHNSSPQPIHQTIHPPMSGGVSTEFKSSSRIE